jgi:hypothetical protein
LSLLVRPCIGCKVILDPRFTKARKYCPDCKDKRQLQKQTALNHARATKRTYGRMFVNLTKNYILFIEGVKK